MDLELLKHLIAFADYGTLSRAAEELLISQPALTRNMQRLEADLGVTLFKRHKNKLSLTETGQLAVKQGRSLLEQVQNYQDQLKQFDLRQSKLFIGVCAPGPIYELKDIWAEKQLVQSFETPILPYSALLDGLNNKSLHLVVTDRLLEVPHITSKVFFKEQLYLSVSKSHHLAVKEGIRLHDLNDMTMLLRTDLGIWEPLVDSLKRTTFIRQADDETFNSLVRASDLPHFTTNVSHLHSQFPQNRIRIPILEPQATVTFYLNALTENKPLLALLTSEK